MEFIISSDSLNKLAAIMGGSSSGGAGGKGAGGLGKLGSVMEKFSLGNVAKLAAIGVGISVGVGLIRQVWKMMVQASPMLQSMLKLFQVGIMFILRPIGDFIGFLLRPMMIYLLRNVFLPWYRTMAPIMRMWGAQLGTGLVNFIKNPFGTLIGWIEGTFVGKLIGILVPIVGIVYVAGKIWDAIKALDIDLGAIATGVSSKVKEFFDSISDTLTGWWYSTMDRFTSFTDLLSNGLTNVVTKISGAWEIFSIFFVGGLGNIGALIGGSWNAFTSWISSSLGTVGETLKGAWNSFISFFQSIGNIWGLIGSAWENFLTFINDLGNILDSLNPGNFFADLAGGLQSGVQNLFGGSTNNNVNVSVNGGSNIAEDAINGLRDLVFGWMEDSNTKRY